MHNASRHALSFLILGFIIGSLLLFAALYLYHDRNLRSPKPSPTLQLNMPWDERRDKGERRGESGGEFVRVMRSAYAEHWIEPEDRDIIILKSGIALRFALIHTLHLLPTLVLFLYISAFSIFFTLSPFQSESFQYHHVAVPSYYTLLSFIFLIILSQLFFIPNLFKDSERIIFRSWVARAALEEAKILKGDNDLQTARKIIEIYLDIDAKNREARLLHDQILEGLYEKGFEGGKPVPEEVEPVEDAFLFQKGLEARSKGDLYLALYYFERALAVQGEDPVRRRYYDETLGEVRRLQGSLSRDERVVQHYIREKAKALAAIDEGGREDLYRAYGILSELIRDESLGREFPDLIEDVGRYYNLVKQKLGNFDFQPEEIAAYDWLPSYDHIIFRDRNGFIDTAARICTWNDNFYLIEITRHSIKDPRLRLSFRYGKWLGNRYRLKGLRGSREYRADTRDFMMVPQGQDEQYYLQSNLYPGYLLFFNERDRLLRQLTVYERFTVSRLLQSSGFDIEDRSVYIARELGSFFGVYVLALVFAGIAWTKRSIYEFPPRFKLLLYLIVTPILCYLFHHLYQDVNSLFIYSHRYAVRYLLKNMNIALYTGIINAVIAALATVYYLSQRNSVE
jgi:hypothetical protein